MQCNQQGLDSCFSAEPLTLDQLCEYAFAGARELIDRTSTGTPAAHSTKSFTSEAAEWELDDEPSSILFLRPLPDRVQQSRRGAQRCARRYGQSIGCSNPDRDIRAKTLEASASRLGSNSSGVRHVLSTRKINLRSYHHARVRGPLEGEYTRCI